MSNWCLPAPQGCRWLMVLPTGASVDLHEHGRSSELARGHESSGVAMSKWRLPPQVPPISGVPSFSASRMPWILAENLSLITPSPTAPDVQLANSFPSTPLGEFRGSLVLAFGAWRVCSRPSSTGLRRCKWVLRFCWRHVDTHQSQSPSQSREPSCFVTCSPLESNARFITAPSLRSSTAPRESSDAPSRASTVRPGRAPTTPCRAFARP